MNSTVQKIFQLMSERKVTAKQVSSETGISQSNFTEWKKGRSNPKIDSIKSIADYFELPVEYFICEDEPENSETPSETSSIPRRRPNNLVHGQIRLKRRSTSVALASKALQFDEDRLSNSISKARMLDAEKQENVINFIDYLYSIQEKSEQESECELPEPKV